MDPSGIIGIISVVAQIVTTCSKLGLSWRDAPEDAKKFKDEMDGLYKTLSETSSLLIQNPDFIAAFEGQHSAVLSNLTTLSSPDNESLLSACQAELARILEGLQKQLEGSRFGWQRFKAVFSGEMTQSAIGNLQRRCQMINSMISIDNTTLAVKTNLEVRSLKKDIAGRHLDERKKQILHRITPIDFTTQQIDNLDRRQEGTGKWLLESSDFEAWVLGDRRTLFCPGMPGAGKTMLSSIVIEHLKRRFEGNSLIGVSFMFCNFRRHDEQTPRDLLASMLKQLYCTMPAECEEVERTYKNAMSSPSTQDIIHCLEAVVLQFSRVFVVIDALDELDDNRNIFLEATWNLQKTSGVNIFATSRHIPEIERYFEDSPHIEIRAADGDVMKFVNGQISKLPLAVRKNEDLQDQIKVAIVQAVQGMFLLAQLHLDSLQSNRSVKAVKETLCKLSSGSEAYDVAYEKAMERIERQLEDQRSLAKDALSWIICARRPLKTLELQHALAVERGTTELDGDNLPELDDIVSACAGLVTIEEKSRIIRLVHYTTQEYFERTKERWMPEAQRLLASSCVTYLSYNRFKSTCMFDEYIPRIDFYTNREEKRYQKENTGYWDLVKDLVTSEYPLYDYAACNWGYHAKYTYPPDDDTLSFLTDSGHHRSSSFYLLLDKSKFPYKSFYKTPPPSNVHGLHLAAYFGLTRIYEHLEGTDETNLNLEDSYGYTPLIYAILGGDEKFLRYLLAQSGLELNKAAGPSGNVQFPPLQLALRCGNEAAARDLIRTNKIDLEAKDFLGDTVFHKVIRDCSVDVFKLLTETSEADLDVCGQPYSFLQYAALVRRIEIVKYLVETRKDNIESPTLEGHTPFFLAVREDAMDVARYLYDTGLINPNVADCRGRTPLHTVAERTSVKLETIQWLLDAGKVDASLLMRTNSGKTPLDLALKRRKPEDPVIRMISERMRLLQTTKIEQAMEEATGGS